MKNRNKYAGMAAALLLTGAVLGGCTEKEQHGQPEPTGMIAQEEDKVLYNEGTLLAERKSGEAKFTNGFVRLVYEEKAGTLQVFFGEGETPALEEVYAKTILKDGTEYQSKDMQHDSSEITAEAIADGFGKGMKISIVSREGTVSLTQNFYLYEEVPYFLSEVLVAGEEDVSSNYIAPLFCSKEDYKTNVLTVTGEDVRFIATPYDNDGFVRYESQPMISARESYEVTAVFDNTTRHGLIIGSVTHDTWKTGIRVTHGRGNSIAEFSVFGGITSEKTSDTLPHGYVSGKEISSPKIFVGYYEDYRDGMEAYGTANATIAPALAWDKGVPMGWNSWAAVGEKVSYDIYTDSSDFVKEFLQDNSFSEDGVVYINFDSFWDNLSEYQLKQAVQYVKANGQIPGIYLTPFTYWGGSYVAGAVPGTNSRYSWMDVVLKDENGTILPAVDGGISLDATHPGTLQYLEYQFNRFKEWGFAYVKLDFMTHGAREGVFYNKEITTGTQAYNYGMSYINHLLEEELENQEFFISLSIAPLFPSQYAHSRRISCDVFGTINWTEYMLNSLTYGWWMNGTIYKYNDPDHIVLYNSYNHKTATMYNEGLSRYISAAIAGTVMLDSDDFRIKGARERVVDILTNEEVNAVAKKGVSFRPVEGNTGNKAADMFVKYDEEEQAYYLAVFNFSSTEKKTMTMDFTRIGIDAAKEYTMYDLCSKETVKITDGAEIHLEEAQPRLFRIRAAE